VTSRWNLIEAPVSSGPESVDAQRFRSSLIAGALACLPLVVTQVGIVVFVTPIFAHMYADNHIIVREPQSTIFALSHHAVLALVMLAFDAALFGAMYLLARRRGRRFLFAPAAVLLVMSFVYVPLMYMPLFQSMTVVK